MQRSPTAVDLRGLVALVTGGGQNIGLAIASALANSGCSVVIVDVNAETASTAAASLKCTGDAASLGCAGDVTDAASMAAVSGAQGEGGAPPPN